MLYGHYTGNNKSLPDFVQKEKELRLLDMFCCQGGASMGYHQAGFDVVGVDLAEKRKYPFDFVQADAIEYLLAHYQEFDVIHASPPCQHFTKYKNCRKDIATRYENLIPQDTRSITKNWEALCY
jgi:DNA (cytosine-5)-methyltransferase 1